MSYCVNDKGFYGEFGGAYVPEILYATVKNLQEQYLSHPQLLGIDLNSRFETAPGLKDVEALRRFIAQLRR